MIKLPTYDEFISAEAVVENRFTRAITWPFRKLLSSLFDLSGEEWHVEQKNDIATFILHKTQKYYTFSTKVRKDSRFLAGQNFKLRYNRDANKQEIKEIKDTIEREIPRSNVELEEIDRREEQELRKNKRKDFVEYVGNLKDAINKK